MLKSLDSTTKKKLITFGIFTAILLLMFLILAGFSFLAKSNWNLKLAKNVEQVLENSSLEEFSDGNFKVGKSIPLNSTFAVSSNLYQITDNSESNLKYALITRITTYYGPLAAVYIYDENEGVTFAGFAEINDRVNSQFVNIDSNLIMTYWKNKAFDIFKNAGVVKGANNE